MPSSSLLSLQRAWGGGENPRSWRSPLLCSVCIQLAVPVFRPASPHLVGDMYDVGWGKKKCMSAHQRINKWMNIAISVFWSSWTNTGGTWNGNCSPLLAPGYTICTLIYIVKYKQNSQGSSSSHSIFHKVVIPWEEGLFFQYYSPFHQIKWPESFSALVFRAFSILKTKQRWQDIDMCACACTQVLFLDKTLLCGRNASHVTAAFPPHIGY